MVLHRLVYPSQCFSWNTGKWLPWTFDFLQLSSPNFKNLFSVCPRWPAVTCMISSFILGKNVSTLSVLWYRFCRLGTVKFILYLITLRHNYVSNTRSPSFMCSKLAIIDLRRPSPNLWTNWSGIFNFQNIFNKKLLPLPVCSLQLLLNCS
jgi:hypothetical protein